MTQILNFPISQTKSNISFLPNIFTILVKVYKKHQNENQYKKITFIGRQAYKYFYNLYSLLWGDAPEIPEFVLKIQAKKYAQKESAKIILDIIAEDRLKEFYINCARELKRTMKEMRK